MSEQTFDELEEIAFQAVEQIIGVNRDVYVTQVKLEVAEEFNREDQVTALKDKLIELLQQNREHMFTLLDAVVRIGEQGRRSKRFMELYKDLVELLSDPNSVSLYTTQPTDKKE